MYKTHDDDAPPPTRAVRLSAASSFSIDRSAERSFSTSASAVAQRAATASVAAVSAASLHVEYAEGSTNYDMLFIFSLFYEYRDLEYEHVPV